MIEVGVRDEPMAGPQEIPGAAPEIKAELQFGKPPVGLHRGPGIAFDTEPFVSPGADGQVVEHGAGILRGHWQSRQQWSRGHESAVAVLSFAGSAVQGRRHRRFVLGAAFRVLLFGCSVLGQALPIRHVRPSAGSPLERSDRMPPRHHHDRRDGTRERLPTRPGRDSCGEAAERP